MRLVTGLTLKMYRRLSFQPTAKRREVRHRRKLNGARSMQQTAMRTDASHVLSSRSSSAGGTHTVHNSLFYSMIRRRYANYNLHERSVAVLCCSLLFCAVVPWCWAFLTFLRITSTVVFFASCQMCNRHSYCSSTARHTGYLL